jgi:polyferredoxin
MECVHCTQCIDACDDIMTKVGKPTGLIRYSSQDAIAGKPRQLVRMRTILYPVVLTILIGGLITALFLKESADLTVLRGGLDGPFTEEADGRVSNQIRIKITNRRSEAMPYTITLDGLAQAGLRPDEITIVAPENPLKVDAGATRSTSLFVLLPRRGFANGERMITISVTDGRRYQESVNYRLLGPVGNAPTGKFR